ncbi:centromere-associated protein E isoform 3-T3 [Anomaloglossus baeobatrachus]|uniref:centromere-associated protein E isoform X3 n=1 Tax=Anomaloglossus baeobatrachus TaxID=238106 RepID=UPI003F4F6440
MERGLVWQSGAQNRCLLVGTGGTLTPWKREQGEQVNPVWKAENNTITQVDGARSFNFDRVFHSHETTCQVYQEVAVPIIHSAIEGYNGTIFAYGQTSSGKTYTMMGTPHNLGIIPQAVDEVFKIIQEIPNREFLLRVSYMEIYNESVTDLLCDDRKKKPLEVREDFNRTVYVADLTEEVVTVPELVMQWIKKGEKNRHYGETKMNDHSSRSHTIFRMIVESRERNDPGNSENCDGAVMVSHLNLVDLAGSERASQTGAEGVRLKEGCNINRSLFILGQVIKKLSDGQVGGFINYRDSKLTRILQNSLGGNTKTVMICTITPISLDETLSTLQFASTAKHVKNTPYVNEVLDDHALLKRYRKEIMGLKKQLEELEASTDIKTHAMAKEEHSQLLSEIKELQKEREDRIWNLANMVVASSSQPNEDQRVKRRRRVTWAPGKLQDSLCSAGVSTFDIGSRLAVNFAKRRKVSDFSTIAEIDDSICTEFSDLDDTGRVLDVTVDADWNLGSSVACREKTALSHSMTDFSSESTSALMKDTSLQKCKEMEQKVAELENQLKKMTKEYEVEVGKREYLEKENADLKQAKSNTEKDVETLQLGLTCVKDQSGTQPEDGEQSPVPGDYLEEQEKLKMDDDQVLEAVNDSPLSTQIDGACQDPDEEGLSRNSHDICLEQIRNLEQKIADLEGSTSHENNGQNDLLESLQICEALMAEKQRAHDQLGNMQNDFDHLMAENESLKKELADLEICLQEKHEINEFEILEKQAQKDHEAQLTHENTNLKKLIDNAEVYNKELENEVEDKLKLLLEREKHIAELKKESEILQKKARCSDLMASMGNGEKLCEEVFQMQQSLSDAEMVTRDAQREASFLKSENLEMKEKMDELLIRCEKREKDASDYEKQLEIEKCKYKRMQNDLQKELQYAFNEISQLNGLLIGKVPKELLSRIELEKKVEDYSKQLASILEEKNDLEQKVVSLSESLHLHSEVENLKDQAERTSEELILLKSGKEQSASVINDQEHKLQEQSEQLEKLTGEIMQLQGKYQQAEQQYSELKVQHEAIQERCSLTAGELTKKDSEAQCLLMEVECVEQQLSAMLKNKDCLLLAIQVMETRLKEFDELFKSTSTENDKLQDQVKQLSLEVSTLQQQSEKQSELYKEKQDLEEKYNALLSVKEELQDQLRVSSLNVLEPENAEPSSKLQELQDELSLAMQHRNELLDKMQDLEAEKNNLKQDLNENIELSIETQDELRNTQEELKQQKHLVADLRKQFDSDGDASRQAESQKDILEGKLSVLTEKLQQNEAKCESLTNEKQELERVHQSLISEMTVLQERMYAADLAMSKLEEENTELKQNKPKSWELNRENLRSDPNTPVKQEEDGRDLQLQDQMLAMLQEKDAVHETLKNLTAERDQLKLDLQENIEMSIDTQEELRNALDELTAKTQLSESLRTELNELKVGENGESNRTVLQCEVEEKGKIIKELETKMEDVLRNLQETESKHIEMVETLDLITKEKDNLISSLTAANNNLVNDLAMYKQDKSTQDQALQVSIEMPTNDQVDTAARQEEIETERNQLSEALCQLQQQLNIISQEKGELQQSIDNFKAENEAMSSERECDLKNEIEKLTEQLKAVQEQQLVIAESEAAVDYTDMETNVPEENVPKNPTLLEEMQGENLELLSKLGLLQEELQKETAHRDDLQRKLEGVINENARLQENLESVLSCSSRAQEELQSCQEELKQHINLVTNLRMEASHSTPREDKETITDLMPCLEEEENLLLKNPEYLQLIEDKETLEQERNGLSSQLAGLNEVIKETQTTVVSLQNENLEAERKILDLQQQIEKILEERDDLKNNQQWYSSEMNQENQMNTEDGNMQDMEAQLASLRNEKSNIEEKLLNLQQHTEMMTNESDELRVTIQSLQSEREQLNEDLREKVLMAIENQDDLRKARDALQQQVQKVEELTCKIASLEQKSSSVENQLQETVLLLKEASSEREIIELSKQKVMLDLEDLHKEMETKHLAVDEAEKERSEAEHKILDLTVQLQTTFEERNQMQRTNEELQKLATENQDDLRKAQDALQQQVQTVEELTCKIASLEQKSSSVENQLQKTVLLLKEASSERETIELSKQKLILDLEDLHKEMETKHLAVDESEKERSEAEQKILNLTVQLQTTSEERNQMQQTNEELQKLAIENQGDLIKARDDLQQQVQRVEELTCKIASLEQKSSSVENQLQETVLLLNEASSEREIIELSKQKLILELENLHKEMETKHLAVDEAEKERSEAEQKILDLTVQLQTTSEERNQMQRTNEELQKLATENQDDLRKAQDAVQQQVQRVEELTCKIASLEQKSSSVENQLQETVLLLKEASSERETIELSKQKLILDLENLHKEMETKHLAVDESEKERCETEQKILDLTVQLQTTSEERNQMQQTNKELQKLSTEIQDELQKTKEELQQQKQSVEKLTNEISFLHEKSSSLECELMEKTQILEKVAEDERVFDQSKQNLTAELEQVMEALKSKDFELKEAEKRKAASSQKIIELSTEMENITQEKDYLQNSRQKLEEEAVKLTDEMQQLRHERDLLTNEQVRKNNQLKELETELQQIQEKMRLSESSTKQMETENVALLKQLQQCELDVASLRQEQEQFQQLLQRARSEKEIIYDSLQDQEKAVAQAQDELTTSKVKLQTVMKERDESNAHLLEKVNEVKERLQEISSLQEQIQQLHKEVNTEKLKNLDLSEKVDLLEKEVRVLRLMQSEPEQEVDELVERTENLEEKNQDWKDLMMKIYKVYSDHHSLLNNVSSELQSMGKAQNQSMSAIKETLSSTFSRTFGNLQTEHFKLNAQMQMLLNKFKVLCRNALVQEEHYNSVTDCENELCALQRKNDQLLLQCQSLEQCGSKWSETAALDLKFCEIEFLNKLILMKFDVIKNVEDGFSVVQVSLNTMESELKQELKYKEEFHQWLSEFQGLHFDAKKLNDGIHQENRRIAGVIQDLTKKLKIIAQSKTKQDTMMYIHTLNTDLQEKKTKNMDLMQKMQKIAPSGDCSILEEENARLRETLKNVQRELKKMQCRIQDLEKQLSAVEADAKHKEQRALLLEDKLRSKVAESELSEMQANLKEKDKQLQAMENEVQTLKEKLSKGAAPFNDEIESLKSRVVWLEMGRVKLTKATNEQISSLKASVEDKETRIRKLREELRRTQKDSDTSVCATNSISPQYPLTCGGGSGIVQSTAMLMLQSQNAALKREVGQYKRKVNQLSRSSEDKAKKLKEKSPETPTTLCSSLHSDEILSHSDTDPSRATPGSPQKTEMPPSHIASEAKAGTSGDNPHLLSRIDVHRPHPMSPNKLERHSISTMSPPYGKRLYSPLKTEGPLFSSLTSPCKKRNFPEKVDSPKEKFYDARSKTSLYYPSKFFDNSTLGPLPDFSAETAADRAINDWWDRTGKTDKPNDCKPS